VDLLRRMVGPWKCPGCDCTNEEDTMECLCGVERKVTLQQRVDASNDNVARKQRFHSCSDIGSIFIKYSFLIMHLLLLFINTYIVQMNGAVR
jgi:hypothetical protein